VPDAGYLIAAVALAAGITFALRALPFAVIEPLRASRLAAVLADRMPAGLLLILVAYLLRDTPAEAPPAAATTVVAVLLVAVLQWWRANALLSIVSGTALYLLATNVVVH
jgi:branched-subunit amino acid transport protein AzlD